MRTSNARPHFGVCGPQCQDPCRVGQKLCLFDSYELTGGSRRVPGHPQGLPPSTQISLGLSGSRISKSCRSCLTTLVTIRTPSRRKERAISRIEQRDRCADISTSGNCFMGQSRSPGFDHLLPTKRNSFAWFHLVKINLHLLEFSGKPVSVLCDSRKSSKMLGNG